MKPAPLSHARPASLAEALALLAAHDGAARCLSGGQTLLPMLGMRMVEPGLLVDLGGIPGLARIAVEGDALVFGARATHRAIETSAEVARHMPVLVAAARAIAHLTIRNRGTIGGSLAHADPAAEWPLMAVLLDARVRLARQGGEREVPAREFFTGPLETVRASDEILTEIRFSLTPGRRTWGFHEMARRQGDFALAAVAADVAWTPDGTVARATLAVGGVHPVPLAVTEAGTFLVGTRLDDAAIAQAADLAAERCDPGADVHASAAYRRRLVGVLARRALADARTDRPAEAAARPRPSPAAAPPRVAAAEREIAVDVNGRRVAAKVPARLSLADFLRENAGLTGTRLGCEHGVCGACTVELDGSSARACLTLAVQADGAAVRTVEGLADGDTLAPLQRAFWDHHALQCGFCTSGMLMTASDLLADGAVPDEAAVREALSGNLCRCTGYANIVRAVLAASGRNTP